MPPSRIFAFGSTGADRLGARPRPGSRRRWRRPSACRSSPSSARSTAARSVIGTTGSVGVLRPELPVRSVALDRLAQESLPLRERRRAAGARTARSSAGVQERWSRSLTTQVGVPNTNGSTVIPLRGRGGDDRVDLRPVVVVGGWSGRSPAQLMNIRSGPDAPLRHAVEVGGAERCSAARRRRRSSGRPRRPGARRAGAASAATRAIASSERAPSAGAGAIGAQRAPVNSMNASKAGFAERSSFSSPDCGHHSHRPASVAELSRHEYQVTFWSSSRRRLSIRYRNACAQALRLPGEPAVERVRRAARGPAELGDPELGPLVAGRAPSAAQAVDLGADVREPGRVRVRGDASKSRLRARAPVEPGEEVPGRDPRLLAAERRPEHAAEDHRRRPGRAR